MDVAANTGAPPRVSVIVPVRDRRRLLRQALDALAAQTFHDFEVVVVDDGSTDGSAAEAEADAGAGRAVRLVRGPAAGAVAARRAGVAAARGSVLAFTDSDCVPARQWLAAGVAAVDAGADVVVGPTWPTRRPLPGERTLASSGRDGLYRTCNVFYRRGAFDAAGGFDGAWPDRAGFRPGARARHLGFGEDTLLGWRVARAGRSVVAADAVVHHEVFPPDLRDSLRRAWMAGAFPALVGEVPELRRVLLRGRVLLGTERLPLQLALAAVATRRPGPPAGAVAVWGALRARRLRREQAPATRVVAALPGELACDLTLSVALLAGSVRARRLVL